MKVKAILDKSQQSERYKVAKLPDLKNYRIGKMGVTSKSKILISLSITLLCLNGCGWAIRLAVPPPRTLDKSMVNESKTTGFMPAHANFCGPGHPKLFAKSKEDRIQELKAINSFDDIDAACQRHDICYEKNGFGDNSCDSNLIYDLKSLRLDWRCSSLRFNILIYFGITSDYMSPFPSDTIGRKIINTLFIPVRFVVMGAAWGIHTLYGYNQPAGRFEKCNNMPP